MPNYQNAQIYKLQSKDKNIKKIYIGSTCNFSKRKNYHKTSCCDPNDKSYNYPVYKYIRENGHWYEWEMVKIKDYPCNLKKELVREEGKMILEYGFDNCLNSRIAGRTREEYYEQNKEAKLEQMKKYHEANKEQLKIKMICECGSTFRISDKVRHYKTIKHKRFIESK